MKIDLPEPYQNPYSKFIFMRTYSRWQDELQRRENWSETVDRATEFLFKRAGDALTHQDRVDIARAIYLHQVMPSKRLIWSAGPAAESNNVAIFNCSYCTIDDLRAFSEAIFILMSGTGFGFSVESEFVEELPRIYRHNKKLAPVKFIIPDNKEGWAESLRFGMEIWYQGGDVDFDFSELRQQGARLKTMGGRSSGPEPLRRLLEFTRAKIKERAGRRLRPIDAHDILCMTGEVVVAGGVRRSSEISLSDLDDPLMRQAKFGAFYNQHPYRAMANNSVAYNEKPSSEEFMEEFLNLVKSGSGERGIFVRHNLGKTAPRRKRIHNGGTNPCGEIELLPMEFCNLSSIISRPDDTLDSLLTKSRLAAILGTIQSTFTDFPYLRKEWKENCERERLLGVCLSGQMDSPLAQDAYVQQKLRECAIETNLEFSQKLGISQSVAVTACKPAGTESQEVWSSSGMHAWWSKYFIRRVRISVTDPLFRLAKDSGMPVEPEVGQDPATASTWVISWPCKAPDGVKTRHDVTALWQLEYWKQVKTHYTEHNPSITIYVKKDEWPSVLAWVYENWDIVGGISFLPSEDHIYRLAPYEEITEEDYNRLLAELPEINYELLSLYEKDDNTTGARDFACVSGVCEI